MVLADSGEAAVVFCSECSYAANVEKAECLPRPAADDVALQGRKGECHTPGTKTIDQVADYLGIAKTSLIKSIAYKGDNKFFLVLVRGDREINEIKVNNTLGPFVNLRLADPQEVLAMINCEPGFVGPVGLPEGIFIAADLEVAAMKGAVCGANKKDYHLLNVVCGEDFQPALTADFRMVTPGEPCPKCSGHLLEARGIEVGQVFNLGTKYSEKLKATYLDDKGKEQVCYMGCYGVGVSRTMSAAIEQNHDENGIIWPMPMPRIIVMRANCSQRSGSHFMLKNFILNSRNKVGNSLDDTDERAGGYFKDADLVGYPLRLTIGQKALAEGKWRCITAGTGRTELIEVKNAAKRIKRLLRPSISRSSSR
jgi:prolyl-tRNA synthetase